MSDIAFAAHHHHEPCWQDARQIAWQLNRWQRDWLLDSGSLTARLRRKSQGQLSVTILRQQLLYPYLSEARLLGIPLKKLALVREVLLSGGDTPWVFARSVLPLTTLSGRLRRLRKLDNRPLGELLFREPGMRRGEIQVARVGCDNRYLPLAFKHQHLIGNQRLWGRRSKFYLDDKPLLVSEVFLDTFIP